MLEDEIEEEQRRQSLIARHAERFARTVDRRELLKRTLIAATTVAFLDKVATARGDDGGTTTATTTTTPTTTGATTTAPDGTPLTFPSIAASPNCCCCSDACYNVSGPNGVCGCEVGCCYDPAHSGNPCVKRFTAHTYPSYCWTCTLSGTKYVCCDYYCGGSGGTPCICSRSCSGSGNCGSCS